MVSAFFSLILTLLIMKGSMCPFILLAETSQPIRFRGFGRHNVNFTIVPFTMTHNCTVHYDSPLCVSFTLNESPTIVTNSTLTPSWGGGQELLTEIKYFSYFRRSYCFVCVRCLCSSFVFVVRVHRKLIRYHASL